VILFLRVQGAYGAAIEHTCEHSSRQFRTLSSFFVISLTAVAQQAPAPSILEKESGTVVNGNPLDDIRNARNVEDVVTNGMVYHTAELWQSVGFKP
jgi:hypothetical protein